MANGGAIGEIPQLPTETLPAPAPAPPAPIDPAYIVPTDVLIPETPTPNNNGMSSVQINVQPMAQTQQQPII